MICRSFALSCFVLATVGASAQMVQFNWAANGLAGAIGAPDNVSAALGTDTITAFGAPVIYTQSSFAAFLGVSVATLQRGDVISFEGNGGSAPVAHYESSTWALNNGPLTQTIQHNETNPTLAPGVLATGSMSQASYNAFFGLSGGSSSVISWIMLDSLLDVGDSGFNMVASGRAGQGVGEGTPDPDAIGTMCLCVPEPGTYAALSIGLIAMIRRRKI